MQKNGVAPILGVLTAISITSAMDASGLFAVSALPLFPLMVLFWYLQRFSRAEMALAWGRRRYYGTALLHPLLLLGLIALIAWIAGAINLEKFHWKTAWLNFAIVALSTALVVVVTEEGFFRGWLWASLKRAGQSELSVLVWSSFAFALWHWSAVVLETSFNPPLAQVPTFMVNAALMGAIWGMLRSMSGSVVVSSVCHGVWNGGAYIFFGFGKEVGKLGIQQNGFYGPEVGVLGLALNMVFALGLWQWCKQQRPR
jgi:membrane protease YdiL (CAAX protease family)